MNQRAPNIVYILADDLGYGDVSCLNERSKIYTPNIDSLAADGMKFTDAHASSAVCTPSRYSILTGRYCWRSTLKESVGYGYSPHLIEDGRSTVASYLQSHGYRTACIGKWHLGFDWSRSDGSFPADEGEVDFTRAIHNGPTSFGFDYFFGISASLDMAPHVYIENDRVTALPDRETANADSKRMWRKGPTGADFHHIDVLPTLTRKAREYVLSSAGSDTEPFFLYFPLPAPHTPILPTAEFLGKSGTNLYGDFVMQCDAVVGEIMDAVEAIGETDNTLFIFTSDNGCSPNADFRELALYNHNPSYVFRGHKADIYDGGHRIPLVARWPALIPDGSTSSQIVCLADLFATCAQIFGERLPDTAAEDSVSILPVLRGEEGEVRDAIVHHSIDGSFSIRKGKWKLELCAGSGGWSWPRVNEIPAGAPEMQLYDMHEDVGERRNCIDSEPAIVEELIALLSAYVVEGRSTPGKKQKNTGPERWPQLRWLDHYPTTK